MQRVERPAFADVAEKVLDMAAADARASDAQLELLDAAIARGEVTFDDLIAAVRAQDQCLVEGGFNTGGVVIEDQALPPRAHSAFIQPPNSMDEAQASAFADSCDAREAKWIGYLYDRQPQAADAYWDKAEPLAPAIRDCILDHGVPEELAGTNTGEIVQAAVKLLDGYGDFAMYPTADCLQGLDPPTTNW